MLCDPRRRGLERRRLCGSRGVLNDRGLDHTGGICPSAGVGCGTASRENWDAKLLQAESLAAFRGDRLVLRDVSFEVAAAGALILSGANGSGKSTLLRVLAGLLRPAAGRLLWHGHDAFGESGHIAYVGHQDAVKPGLSVAENLAFFARMGRRGSDAPAALNAVGLGDLADLPARMLSAGQKRRLALARLGVSSAAVWLLDEPTLGLDSASVASLGGLFAAHRAKGGMVIAATHLPLPLPDAAQLRLP